MTNALQQALDQLKRELEATRALIASVQARLAQLETTSTR